jgi:hypothetical protein
MTRKLVIATWEDSSQPSAWQWLRRTTSWPVIAIRTVGWVIHDDESVLVLAPSLSLPDEDGDQQVCGAMKIPRRAVVSVEVLA